MKKRRSAREIEDDELFVALAIDMQEDAPAAEDVPVTKSRDTTIVDDPPSDALDDELLVALAIDLRPEPEPEPEPEDVPVVKAQAPIDVDDVSDDSELDESVLDMVLSDIAPALAVRMHKKRS